MQKKSQEDILRQTPDSSQSRRKIKAAQRNAQQEKKITQHHISVEEQLSDVPPGLVPKVKYVYDRGPRPLTRGWFHFFAALLAVIAASVLVTYSYIFLPWWQALGVLIYGISLVCLFGVSAAYHRGAWKSLAAVTWWRRADHSMIAVFIAATYTPLCLIVLPHSLWMLALAWAGAIAAVLLNMVWINHPRWLDMVVYLAIGWLIIPLIPQLWHNAGPTVVWLLLAGGIVYSLGALCYAFKWPGRNAKILGYHEIFHAATVIAAIVHLIAVWIVVVHA